MSWEANVASAVLSMQEAEIKRLEAYAKHERDLGYEAGYAAAEARALAAEKERDLAIRSAAEALAKLVRVEPFHEFHDEYAEGWNAALEAARAVLKELEADPSGGDGGGEGPGRASAKQDGSET